MADDATSEHFGFNDSLPESLDASIEKLEEHVRKILSVDSEFVDVYDASDNESDLQ
jgi:hypothetical protein